MEEELSKQDREEEDRTGNVLVKMREGSLIEDSVQLMDLGGAVLMADCARGATLSHRCIVKAGEVPITTLTYRAAELLFGEVNFTRAIDIWSAGAVMYELASLDASPTFISNTKDPRRAQRELVNARGSPTDSYLRNLVLWEDKFSCIAKQPFPKTVSERLGAGAPLCDAMLTYEPWARVTASNALRHAYFQEALPSDSSQPDVPSPCITAPPASAPSETARAGRMWTKRPPQPRGLSSRSLPEGCRAKSWPPAAAA